MSQAFKVGQAYTNDSESLIREITALEGRDVVYSDFTFSTGRALGSGLRCLGATFARWAERECRPEEVLHLRRDETTFDYQVYADLTRGLPESLLRSFPSDRLVVELARRLGVVSRASQDDGSSARIESP